MANVSRERVVLIYHLMKGLPVNVRAILRQNMLKFRTNRHGVYVMEASSVGTYGCY